MSDLTDQCGTHPGYQAHRRHGERPCQSCRQAHVKYEKRRIYDVSQGRPRQVSPTGTQRRIQGLVALGWTYGRIGEGMGVTAGAVYRMATRYSPTVFRSTAEKVAVVYEQLSMTLPPIGTRVEKRDASYARTVARKRGWVVPLAWDDATIDDPDAKPYSAPAPGRPGRPVNNDQRIEDAEWMADADETLTAACDRLGIKPDSLRAACKRAGRMDVYDRLADRENDADARRGMRALKRGAAA